MGVCKFCGTSIVWVENEKRQKKPIEDNGSLHDCENFKRSRESYRKIQPTDLDPEIIKQYENSINEKASKK